MRPAVHHTIVASLLLGFCTAATAEVEDYQIDPTHSFANWSIRHVVSKTSGTFPDIRGSLHLDRKDLANSSVDAVIQLASVNSSHAKRDDNIKKEGYLDVLHFPEMRFVSSKVEVNGDNAGIITGTLTLHGVSQQISLPFKVLGFGADPFGGYRTGVEAHTVIKASDFGYPWASKPKSPIGDDIEVTLLIEGVRKYAEPTPLK